MKPVGMYLSLPFILLLSACTVTQQQIDKIERPLFEDQHFAGFELVAIETEEQIFNLDSQAQAFVEAVVSPKDTEKEQMHALAEAIFDRSKLDLLYISSANTVASETFKSRAANCLSLSIMTYAMAKHAGFDARFHDVAIPAYWTRKEGYSLLNGHVNVQIYPQRELGVLQLFTTTVEVDFDPQTSIGSVKKTPLSRDQIVALFYNNKGVDELINNNWLAAYKYFRSAIALYPSFDPAIVNLGLLYRKNNLVDAAEKAYMHALALNENNYTAHENLAYLYNLSGEHAKANELMAAVTNRLKSNPYYHYNLGEHDFDNQQYNQALAHFRDALKLDKSKHQIYYGLAKVYFQLGDVHRSKRYLVKAKRKSLNLDEQNLYQSKLEMLSTL